MNLPKPLPGDEPQPEVRAEGAFLGVLGQPLCQVEISFLQNVGRVDSALETAIEPQPDHLPQTIAVPLPELRETALVSRGRAPHQCLGLA